MAAVPPPHLIDQVSDPSNSWLRFAGNLLIETQNSNFGCVAGCRDAPFSLEISLEVLFFKVGAPAQRGLQPSFATSLLTIAENHGAESRRHRMEMGQMG